MPTSLERADYRVTFGVLVLGVSAYSLLQSLVIPALTTIQLTMHTSQNTVTWVVTAYLLSASIFTPIMGRIGDILGKEHVMVATLIALSLGSVVAGLAHSVTVLIIGRAVQGIGGGVMPLAFGIIRDEFPRERLASAIGIIAAMTAVGGGIGLIVAGPILQHLGIHWLFWIPLIMTSVAAILTYLLVPESPERSSGRISISAALLLSAWLVALLVAVSEAPTWGWLSPKTLGLLVLAIVLLAIWVVVELRVNDPVVDMKMMRIPAVWTNNLVAFLFGIGMYSIMAFLPEFVQTPRSAGYGFSASTVASGLYLMPLTIGMFFVGLYSGKIANRFGSKTAVVAGSAISAIGYGVLAFAHSTSVDIYLASGFLGVGLGLAFSAMSNLIVRAVSANQTGIASGMNANIRTIGGAVGAGVMSSIVTARVLPTGAPTESGYAHGFIFLAACTALAVVAAIFIPAVAADNEPHLNHAELAIVPGGTLTEG
ncbi:MAG TPA: MFS transporter [Acidimicrobiales bacterium]|nr:MFS transporter [Acidimicrobiales bacterium]